MIERLGLVLLSANAWAMDSTVIEPDPSSSAPLYTESTRPAGWVFRTLSIRVLIRVACSAEGIPGSFSAPMGRMTLLKAQIESASTGSSVVPMWSL
mgnify:CR=1 FL=1